MTTERKSFNLAGACGRETSFHLITLNTTMSMGLMGQATVEEDVVAIKQ